VYTLDDALATALQRKTLAFKTMSKAVNANYTQYHQPEAPREAKAAKKETGESKKRKATDDGNTKPAKARNSTSALLCCGVVWFCGVFVGFFGCLMFVCFW
jgi:hypothetical protein